jgi:CRISPR-associated endonuclease/helicase Cas3
LNLSVDDFDAFHRAVHDQVPFDWQNRLLRQIVEERAWPRVLDLPTGSGKTTCIDIALFALALDAAASPRSAGALAESRWSWIGASLSIRPRIAVARCSARSRHRPNPR